MGGWGNICWVWCKADEPFPAGNQLGAFSSWALHGHHMGTAAPGHQEESWRDPGGLRATGCCWMCRHHVHVCAGQTQHQTGHKDFTDQGRGEQSPPFPSCLSAFCKCLFVVKSRVKAPPCGRSLALAQVNVVFTPWSIQGALSWQVAHSSMATRTPTAPGDPGEAPSHKHSLIYSTLSLLWVPTRH